MILEWLRFKNNMRLLNIITVPQEKKLCKQAISHLDTDYTCHCHVAPLASSMQLLEFLVIPQRRLTAGDSVTRYKI
jgi:hypothetical protein